MPRLLLLVLCFNGLLIAGASSVRFELIRAGPSAGATQLEHLRALVESDARRQKLIWETIQKRHQRRKACEVGGGRNANGSASFAMAMTSGAYAGTGEYFVRFRVGTPAQRFLLVADTGSDLTWVHCRYRQPRCRRSCRRGRGVGNGRNVFRRQRPVFHADASSSFVPIRCSSEMCKASLPFSLAQCPTPVTPCAYDYGYNITTLMIPLKSDLKFYTMI